MRCSCSLHPCVVVFFFKQKTAYEMRISDWSSDVCSSDLLRRARIAVDGRSVIAERPLYLMLNKPRGLVTTRRDPQERGTVYDCLPPDLPFLSPVGRLDKASEGLLLKIGRASCRERVCQYV